MKKSSKILLAAATIWPFFYMLLFFGFIFLSFLDRPTSGVAFAAIFPLHILTMLLMFALTAIYIVNVFRNERVAKDMKVLWAVVIFMGSVFAMPIYWYLYIWPEAAAPAQPAQLGTSAPSYTHTADTSTSSYVPPRQPPDWR